MIIIIIIDMNDKPVTIVLGVPDYIIVGII